MGIDCFGINWGNQVSTNTSSIPHKFCTPSKWNELSGLLKGCQFWNHDNWWFIALDLLYECHTNCVIPFLEHMFPYVYYVMKEKVQLLWRICITFDFVLSGSYFKFGMVQKIVEVIVFLDNNLSFLNKKPSFLNAEYPENQRKHTKSSTNFPISSHSDLMFSWFEIVPNTRYSKVYLHLQCRFIPKDAYSINQHKPNYK